MKKTEKIEVRLSHEEKTALTTLTDQEGRSVSDLVRGLIERYMSINTETLPRKTPWLKFMGIAVFGFLRDIWQHILSQNRMTILTFIA